MGSTHVQVVEGNPHLRSLLGWHLQQAGYVIHLSAGLHQARGVFQSQQPELMIVDSDLPDGSGVEFCRWLRRQQQILIFILSAQTSEVEIVAGLKAGADDYLKKPFGIQEFLARVEALVRRSRPAPSAYLNYGELKVNLVQRRVHYQGEPIDLTPRSLACSMCWLKLEERRSTAWSCCTGLGQTPLTILGLSIPTCCRCEKRLSETPSNRSFYKLSATWVIA